MREMTKEIILINLIVVFNFKEKNSIKEIKNQLQNIRFGPLNTMRAEYMNCYFLRFKIRVRELPFPYYKTFRDLQDKYRNVLKEISFKGKIDLDLDWEGEKIAELSQSNVDEFLNTFLDKLDPYRLEVIINNAFLDNDDIYFEEDELDELGLINNLSPIRELFLKSDKKLKEKQIRKIFELINTNDYLILKQVFYVLLQRSKLKKKELFDLYHRVKGKVPFSLKYLKYVWDTENAESLVTLELFFKEYIMLEGIIEIVREKLRKSIIDVKVQIPFDLKAYELDKRYRDQTSTKIAELFDSERAIILEIFKFVLAQELKRLGVHHDGLLCSFSYDDSDETVAKLRDQKYYYDNLKDMYDDKLEEFRRATKDGTIKEFVIFRGHHITDRNRIDFDWSRVFKIRDSTYQRIQCKVIHNRTYFNSLSLDMEAEIEIQANLIVKYKWNKKAKTRKTLERYLQVIDIKLIDNFRVIKYHLGTYHGGEKYLENTKQGLSMFIYPLKGRKSGIIQHTKILDCPIKLLNVYEGENDLFYEIKLNGSIICKPKDQIIDYMDKLNLVIDENLIRKATSQILRESIREYNITPKPMYNTVGVFLSKKNDDLLLVYKNDDHKRIIGENDLQIDLIENIEEKNLDKAGDLAKIYYSIIHLPTLPEHVRISILGFSAILPFFFVLSNHIDLLPLLFLIGKHGSGKTTTTRIFLNYLYGTEIKKADDIRSEARFTKFLTESALCTNIDDFDRLPDNHLGFIKTYSSQRGKRYRMKKNQEFIKEQLYATIAGSANKKEFLTKDDDEAFRLRCIIHELNVNIERNRENKVLCDKFIKLEQKLISSDYIFGYYLLTKAFEYIEKSISEDISKFNKLKKLFFKKYNIIANILEDNEINLIDTRRITIYTLIIIGLEIWDYVFKTKELESPLTKKTLNLENKTFMKYIEELEINEMNLSLEIFDSILEFFRQNYEKYSGKKTSEDIIVVQTEFTADYDRWAKPRGYETLKTLTRLAELQSKLLNRNIIPKTEYFFDENGNQQKQYGLQFYYSEIRKLRNEEVTHREVSDFKDQKHLNVNDLYEEKDDLKGLRDILSEVQILFEENNSEELDIKSLIQVLTVKEVAEKDVIKNAIETLKFLEAVEETEKGKLRLLKTDIEE